MELKYSKKEFENFKKLMKMRDLHWEIEKKLILKTVKYLRFVKWIPWLRMIAIWNSVAMNSANSNSDIDLFIITTPNRLWFVRIFMTLIFQILWVRKTKKNHKERFCLSFFINSNVLNLEKISIENDIYLYFRILHLKPILNYNNTYEKFIKENEKWCIFDDYKDILANNLSLIAYEEKKKKENNFLLNILEKFFKSIFYPKTLKSHERKWKPFWEIIGDDILKFHEKDKRKEIRNKLFEN